MPRILFIFMCLFQISLNRTVFANDFEDIQYITLDLNGDGVEEIVTLENPNRIRISFDRAGQSSGVVLELEANGELDSMESAGDVNGDKIGDLIVGCSRCGEQEEGKVFIVLGYAKINFADAAKLQEDKKLIVLEGAEPYAYFGFTVKGIGDFDRDGLDDVAIGAPGMDSPLYFDQTGYFQESGTVTILFGGNFSDKMIVDYTNSVTLVGNLMSKMGRVVEPIGDFNGDGYSDFAVGLPYDFAKSVGNNYYGGVIVVLGAPRNTLLNQTGFLSGNHFRSYIGETQYSHTGESIEAIGDVNADGYADMKVGSQEREYILYGSKRPNNGSVADGRSSNSVLTPFEDFSQQKQIKVMMASGER